MALGAIYAIQEAGLKIPVDVALVGYDDRDFAAWIKPALTKYHSIHLVPHFNADHLKPQAVSEAVLVITKYPA